MRVALQVPGLEHDLHHRVAVRHNELPAKAVERQAELGSAARQFKVQRAGVKAAVRRRERHCGYIRPARDRDRAAVQSAREVNLAVETERGMADTDLRGAAFIETGEHNALLVSDTVAVGVLQIVHIRRARHKHPALPGQNAIGITQTGGELRPGLIAAVAVAVLKQRDPTLGRSRGTVDRIRIAAPLHHVEPAALVEGECHGPDHERLGGNELDAEAGLDLKRP